MKEQVKYITPSGEDLDEALSRSRLQAAAPELLEALKNLLECSPCQNGCAPDDMTCANNKAIAAINRAEGK